MAVGATAYITNTTATAFVEVIYSKRAVIAREDACVFGDLVNRAWEDEAEFGASILVPGVSNLSVQTLSPTSVAALNYETIWDGAAFLAAA